MMNNRTRGFTLIELLVVIAIIGILSAVVLASLNTARSKGSDAAIKSNLDTIRTQSGIYYDTNTGFSTGASTVVAALAGTAAACNTLTNSLYNDPNVAAAMAAADKASSGTGTWTGAAGATSHLVCATDGATAPAKTTVWGLTAQLVAVAGTFWCVDSTGASRPEAAATLSATGACP